MRDLCRRVWLRLFFCAVLCAFFLSAAGSGAEEKASKGIFIEGIDVGGMTRDEVKKAIREKVKELGNTSATLLIGDTQVHCCLNDLGVRWSNPEILDEVFYLGMTGNIVKRYKDQKDLEHSTRSFSISYTADEETLYSYLKGCESYNTEPVEATIYVTDELTPGVDGGTDGITLRVEDSVQAAAERIRKWDGKSELFLELPVDRTPPETPYETLAVISDVLGSATTDYSASSSARAANVENGCRKISGSLIWPGEEFSVTAAVTPFSAENGYYQAPSYEENRVVDSYGGGICQVSTTLYNAVLKAELEITARSNHTMVVSYVPLSKDAAIAEGVMDMAFVNTLEDPVFIIGYCYGGTITFTVFGHETRPANRTLEFESRTLETIQPTRTKMYADPTQAVGYINTTTSPHTGYSAELWKNIYIDGELVDSVRVNSSYYNAVGTIYSIGVATSNAALSNAMYTAISSNNLASVQAVIAGAAGYAQQTPQQQTDAQGQPQAQPQAQQPAATPAPPEAPASTGEGVLNPDGSITVY